MEGRWKGDGRGKEGGSKVVRRSLVGCSVMLAMLDVLDILEILVALVFLVSI